jgi:hypothetical protein
MKRLVVFTYIFLCFLSFSFSQQVEVEKQLGNLMNSLRKNGQNECDEQLFYKAGNIGFTVQALDAYINDTVIAVQPIY